jgi:hypothetical protein
VIDRHVAAILLCPFVIVACASGSVTGPDEPAAVSTTGTTPTAARTATTPAVTTTEPPTFAATIAPIDEPTAARMRWSWHPGCPVPLRDLRLLTLRHWDFTGAVRTGELVVHAEQADAMVTVFRRLFEIRFPIERMVLVDEYEGDDQRSMRANNTSGFNCREIDGRPGTWSQHSYGNAVDVNPLLNPWVRGDRVDPPEGRPYADRAARVRGGIYAGDEVIAAFAAVGWRWGGDWVTSKDYQHFSSNGD